MIRKMYQTGQGQIVFLHHRYLLSAHQKHIVSKIEQVSIPIIIYHVYDS
jgi:hypothetical protein